MALLIYLRENNMPLGSLNEALNVIFQRAWKNTDAKELYLKDLEQ